MKKGATVMHKASKQTMIIIEITGEIAMCKYLSKKDKYVTEYFNLSELMIKSKLKIRIIGL